MNTGLVIFDCDGVLVDSEPLSQRALLESLADAGLEMPPELAQTRFLGLSLANVCAVLTDEFGIELTPTHLKRMRIRLYDLFRRELKPIPGIAEAIERLAVPCCVASSSQPERIRLALEVTGLLPLLEPYFEAVLPGLWMNEGGQSATGALLDHIIAWHGAGGQPTAETHRRIVDRVQELRAIEGEAFAAKLHVLPDFHGNRSPRADPHAVGVISGLTLDASFDSLCRLYWRTAVGVALGVRHILDALNRRGYMIDTLHVTGGHTKNPLLMELYAAATGCTVVEPAASDAVLLGTGMVAATACGLYSGLSNAAVAMGQGASERRADGAVAACFERDYRVFLAMHEQRKFIDGLE